MRWETRRLVIEIHREFVGVRADVDGFDLFAAFVVDPGAAFLTCVPTISYISQSTRGMTRAFIFVSKNWQIHSPSAAICSPSDQIDFSSTHILSPRSHILRLVRFAASKRLQTEHTSDHNPGQRNGIASLSSQL
jgi:hypothetical protein